MSGTLDGNVIIRNVLNKKSNKIMDKLELIDMAINMLEQAKNSQKYIEQIRQNLEIQYDSNHSDRILARHCYSMIRSGVGIIEINSEELKDLSRRELYISEEGDE